MPFVKIHREKQYADYFRAYEIFVNDEKAGEIRAGASIILPLENGMSRIFLKIDWCRSNEVELILRDAETADLFCGNNTKVIFALYYILFAPNEYLWLKKDYGNDTAD
jgi:hypothetical protein